MHTTCVFRLQCWKHQKHKKYIFLRTLCLVTIRSSFVRTRFPFFGFIRLLFLFLLCFFLLIVLCLKQKVESLIMNERGGWSDVVETNETNYYYKRTNKLREKLERLQRSHLLLQGCLFWILWRHLYVLFLLMKSKAGFNLH
jgi:hypothetical protein